ncbi:MAG: FAD:protein FMN transferase, partial [Cocleimonas sp.]
VEIGGELRVSGLSQADKKWRIAVEQPDLTTTIAQQGLAITNRAVATSGDYRNYFVEKGIRRSHIIDPKTGHPIKHNLASITVLHESTMLADAYATALMVMGEKKGKTFAEENNLDVLMIIRNEDKFDFWSSSDMFR